MAVGTGFDELELAVASESLVHAVVDLLEVVVAIFEVRQGFALGVTAECRSALLEHLQDVLALPHSHNNFMPIQLAYIIGNPHTAHLTFSIETSHD